MVGSVSGPTAYIAYQVRGLRRKRGWVQKELALRTGLSPLTIQMVEAGRWGGSVKVFARIAAAFDVACEIRFARVDVELPASHDEDGGLKAQLAHAQDKEGG